MDVGVDVVGVERKPSGRRVDDPDIGLVGDQHVNIGCGETGRVERYQGSLCHPGDRIAEYLASLHVHRYRDIRIEYPFGSGAPDSENLGQAAIGMQVGCKNTFRPFGCLDDNSTCAVAKQNRG